MLLKSTVVLAIFIVNLCSGQLPDLPQHFEREWAQFQADHHRSYPSPAEAAERFRIFVDNVRRVLHHNHLFQQGKASFEQHINLFGDRTTEEVRRHRGGFNRAGQQLLERIRQRIRDILPPRPPLPQLPQLPRFARGLHPKQQQPLPASIDWVQLGAVTPVRDQGECGSCWAHSAAGALEALRHRQSGQLIALAVQQLLDCARSAGNNGCAGGTMQAALEYAKSNRSLVADGQYPYRAQQSDECARLDGVPVAETPIRTLRHIANGDEHQLQQVVATVGPVAVAIDSSQQSFHFYRGGVYRDDECREERVDHAVLVVGYGRDEGTGLEYWLVKNSWGEEWGERGYVRIARNAGNACCVACWGVYPVE